MTDFNLDRFAVIADVHGNADALAAVLADVDGLGIGSIFNLGDHVSGPLAPAEALALTMGRAGMISVRGNHDRWVVAGGANMYPSDRIAREDLSQAQLEWLAALPATRRVGDVFLCHGTPRDDLEYWLETVTPEGHVVFRGLPEIARAAVGVDAGLALCAHTHLPRRVDLPDGRVILNPGSVGCPAYEDVEPYPHVVQTGTPLATYAVVERRGTAWATSVRQVPYDPARMAEAARAAGREGWARAVSTGWLRGAPGAPAAR
ncbi:metallophosphoesterase family protein [Albimonas sp. CAU 1670]|uniref:metallophosphoesterase family protein n=1 Tax=Albimonas sp. CAU 1670 TaxID=3032599 RepID=UPI0023DC857E|nr:metallophosphoesterase family protein [Albimonas sp. CAU 1670]MDF2234918.1 metallophosphoesterase family protein [Albimonas sp. CAU 1670]